MNCGKQGYYARDCQQSQSTKAVKGTTTSKRAKEFKGTKGYAVKHFIFCYNNGCQVYKEAKYGASYWLQEPESEKLKEIEEEDRL